MLTDGVFLADRYEILSKVGAGGMSDVYKAKDHILGRFVAIKVLRQEFSEDRNFVTKFRIEAQSAAGLEHPNIVNIYDVGNEDDTYYIVMEYVEGITLKSYIEGKGQLSFKESVSIAIQVARGIEAAHNKGIIHRDIKPQNIMISTDGKVKVTDFGIAKAASSNTISSDVMGSVHYVSPEQARNGFVDLRSDIYSLGIVMYEMVTGRVPFDGDTTVSVAIQHLQEEMTPPSTYAPNLPISFEKIILKCTQKNADRRYQNIEDLINDLRKSLTNPNDDFVVIAPLVDNGKTKVISEDEIKKIKDGKEITPPAENTKAANDTTLQGETEDGEDDDEDDEDDDYILNPKMDKIFTIMGVVVLILIIIAIIYIVLMLTGFTNTGSSKKESSQQTETQTESESESETETETVEMIYIIGMSKEDAQMALEKRGLKLIVIEKKDSDEEEGTILSQSVDKGQKVEKGTNVEVTVASGSNSTKKVSVPNVVGKSEADAIYLLKESNLNYTVKREYSSSVKLGYVISQSPSGGELDENTTVTLTVSLGAEDDGKVTVPNVVGKSQSSGQQLLSSAGLKYTVTTDYSDTVEEGNIISQSVKADSKVEEGTTVKIVVSLGKKTSYYSVSKTVSYEGAVSATFVLRGSNGTKYSSGTAAVKNGSITVTASDMTCESGTLTVVWTVESTDDEGNVSSKTVQMTYDVPFNKQ
ncbi:MAG: Stk1 family PASTA domain-containing Ser/Thr kinase [Agathobacter sp.]|nr:Stk1 family PASTA domain-containing Ser/Thr kinase [Agathobacter sp.]